jgi:hypothetical protein
MSSQNLGYLREGYSQQSYSEDEATWETEDELKEEFAQLFSNLPESRDEILFKGLEFVTP